MKVSIVSIIFSIILLAGSTFIIPDSFAENLFYGKATFERVPDLIVPQKPETFEIKFQYTEGPYVLQNLTAIFQTSPRSAINFVHINSDTVEVNPTSIARIPVNITVDEKIRQEKIFLSVTYEGTGLHGVPFKSAWADSLILDISPKDLKGFALDDCSPTNLKSEPNDGSVLTTCHNINSNSVMAIVNSLSNSTLSLEIPKSMVYSLASTDCKTSTDFFVLVNGEEVEFDVNERVDTNQVIVNVPKGISEVEIIGTTIIPLPSPAQYCGIVEGYDKLYLPPHKQFKNDVEVKFIRCNEGLVFIQKNNDTPSCVKPESIQKLIERGWANANFQPIYSDKQIESDSPNWGIGENLHQGDFFSYSLCHFSYKECQPFEISFWIKSISQDSSQIVFTVYDGNKEIKNEYKLENGQLIPTDPKNATLLEYIDLFKDSVLFLDRFASIDGWGDSGPKNFSEKSWGTYGTISGTQVSPNGTEYVGMPAGNYESNLIVFTQFQKINKIWVVDEIPFPVKAVVWDETYLQPVLTYEFLLLQYGNSSEDPFSIHLSYPAQE